jgi:hypothetical protein
MSRLHRAIDALANCEHPEDQQRRCRTYAISKAGVTFDEPQVPAIDFVRCADCGAVMYPEQGPEWTRAMLVAHVIGAKRGETKP